MTLTYETVMKILRENKNISPEDLGICPVCLYRDGIVQYLTYDEHTHEYYCQRCGFVMEGEPKSDYIPLSKSADEQIVTLRGKVYLLPNSNIGSHLDPSELQEILVSYKTGKFPITDKKLGILLSSSSEKIKKEAYEYLVFLKNYLKINTPFKLSYDDLNEIARVFDKIIKMAKGKKRTYNSRLLISAIVFVYLRRKYIQYAEEEILQYLHDALNFSIRNEIAFKDFVKDMYKLKKDVLEVVGEEKIKVMDLVNAFAERFNVNSKDIVEILRKLIKTNLGDMKIDILLLAIVRYILENRKFINVEKDDKYRNEYIASRRIKRLAKKIENLLKTTNTPTRKL